MKNAPHEAGRCAAQAASLYGSMRTMVGLGMPVAPP
jgi:hypothetical protein